MAPGVRLEPPDTSDAPTVVPATLADVISQLEQRVAADGHDPSVRRALATAHVRHAIETGEQATP